MDVRLITPAGAELRPLEDLALLGSDAGFVWVDIAEWDATAEQAGSSRSTTWSINSGGPR